MPTSIPTSPRPGASANRRGHFYTNRKLVAKLLRNICEKGLASCLPLDILSLGILPLKPADHLGGLFILQQVRLAIFYGKRREFVCPVPASLVKDPSLSPRAKLLYLALAAHADARIGRAYLSLKRLEKLWGAREIGVKQRNVNWSHMVGCVWSARSAEAANGERGYS